MENLNEDIEKSVFIAIKSKINVAEKMGLIFNLEKDLGNYFSATLSASENHFDETWIEKCDYIGKDAIYNETKDKLLFRYDGRCDKSIQELLQEKNVDLYSMYKKSSAWTPIVKRIVEKSIMNLYKDTQIKLNTQHEYYRLDSMIWQYVGEDGNNLYKDTNDKSKLKVHSWKILYAIEYENNSEDWTDELIKLAHLRAECKIIFAYSTQNSIVEKLKFAKKMLLHSQEESLTEKWLIIFGPTSSELNKEKSIADKLKGYKLENKKFVEVL